MDVFFFFLKKKENYCSYPTFNSYYFSSRIFLLFPYVILPSQQPTGMARKYGSVCVCGAGVVWSFDRSSGTRANVAPYYTT